MSELLCHFGRIQKGKSEVVLGYIIARLGYSYRVWVLVDLLAETAWSCRFPKMMPRANFWAERWTSAFGSGSIRLGFGQVFIAVKKDVFRHFRYSTCRTAITWNCMPRCHDFSGIGTGMLSAGELFIFISFSRIPNVKRSTFQSGFHASQRWASRESTRKYDGNTTGTVAGLG